MSQILNKVRDVDPINSDAVKDVLSSFFQNLLKHTEVDCNRWLRALENIINRFPRFCGTHRNTIETYLCTFIDSSNYYNVIEAAKCAQALQQVRPPQEKTATAKTCWRDHLTALCSAAHKLVGALFPNSVDIYKGTSNAPKKQQQSTSPFYTALVQILNIPKTQNTNLNKQYLLGIRLRNVFVFLQATLVEIYPVPKPIQPQLVIELIVRALSVSSGVTQPQDITKAVTVKIQALRTLDALVACLGPNLIPFSVLIFKFVILTLKWCTDNLNEETREVRCSAYNTLRSWLNTLHTHRLTDSARGQGWEDELVQHILKDVTPHKHLVQLTMRPHSSRHLSKKAKRKQANAMLQESSISAHAPDKVTLSEESNDDIAVAALDFAETFLHVCGVFMKPTTHKVLQERMLRGGYSLQALSSRRALALLRALGALRRAAPPAAPPPTHYCLHLYSLLVNHHDHQISKYCSQALLDIRLQLHCSPPSLNFAVELPRTQTVKDAPRMSARNIATLDSLLGRERAPRRRSEEIIDLEPQGTSEDIIDLADEPSSKRPRIDPNDDKISLSSESSGETNGSDDEVTEVTAEENDPQKNTDDDEEMDEEDEVDAGKISVDKDTTAKSKSAEESTMDTEEASNEESSESDTKDSKESKSSYESQDPASVDKSTKETESKDDSQETQSEVESQDSQSTTDETIVKESAANSDANTETEDASSQAEESKKVGTTENIHEVSTQMPNSASGDSADEPRSPRSMEVEVAYDYPNTGGTRITIIDKTEDENLPSTNDTDDLPITCGQVLRNSQDNVMENNKEVENKENEEPKVNGDSKLEKAEETVTDKIGGAKDISVEDMLADFVDEVIDESKA